MKYRHKDGDLENNEYVPYDYDKESKKVRDKALKKINDKTEGNIGLYVKKYVELDDAKTFWEHIDDFVAAVARILNF